MKMASAKVIPLCRPTPENAPDRIRPVTFGFVDRARGSAGLRGARFQAVFGRSSPAGIGWNLWGMLPHLLPQGL